MDMSAAALPARYGHASEADHAHPRFNEYARYRSGMSRLMVDSADFRDWLRQTEYHESNDAWAEHEKYPAFLAWMRAEQGGARKCPAGSFPNNFKYWLDGGRW